MVPTCPASLRRGVIALLVALQVLVPLLCGAAPEAPVHGVDGTAAAGVSHGHAGHAGAEHPGAGHSHGGCAVDWVCLASAPGLRPISPQRRPWAQDADRAPAGCYEVPAPVPIRG